MPQVTWADATQAIGTVSTPIVVGWLAFVLNRRQSRNEVLISARMDLYRLLAPSLNALMCYMTFIGRWRTTSPVEIIEIKRRLDSDMHCAGPLFSSDVLTKYEEFMELCFVTFGAWGRDAQIRTNPYRRRQGWDGTWDNTWDALFAYDDDVDITAAELKRVRSHYDALLAQMVKDLDVTRARAKYTTDLVSLNAHSPRREDIAGRGTARERERATERW